MEKKKNTVAKKRRYVEIITCWIEDYLVKIKARELEPRHLDDLAQSLDELDGKTKNIAKRTLKKWLFEKDTIPHPNNRELLIRTLNSDGKYKAIPNTPQTWDEYENLLISNKRIERIETGFGARNQTTINSPISKRAFLISVASSVLAIIIGTWYFLQKIDSSAPEFHAPEMILIQAGTCLMGSTEENQARTIEYYQDSSFRGEELREVQLDGFFISKYEISNIDYNVFLEETNYSQRPSWWNKKDFVSPNQPVVGVSLGDANSYCEWLSKKTGKHFRIPTEEEWEYAAKGSTTRLFPWGDSLVGDQTANFQKMNEKKPMDIKSFPTGKSVFEVQNMGGNVAEWTVSKDTISGEIIVKGGSWRDRGNLLRCASKEFVPANTKKETLGFRIVMNI